jgi:outer membrane receptor protein involved in Fe transport
LIRSDREERRRETRPLQFMNFVFDQFNDANLDEHGYQVEGQYLYRRDSGNITAGFGSAQVDGDLNILVTLNGTPAADVPSNPDITHPRGYFYGNIHFPDPVLWTAGISYDHIDREDVNNGEGVEVSQLNPKFGIQWNMTDDVRVRAALFRTVKPALINNRTLEPTQVAGFNQFFDDLDAAKSWRYGAGLDWRPTDEIFTGAEFTWRDLDDPVFQEGDTKFEARDEQLHRGYVYWAPLSAVTLSAELIYDRYEAEEGAGTALFDVPERVETLSVPLTVRYFHPTGLFAGTTLSYVNQDVRRSESAPLANGSGSDDFLVVDALVGYRLPKRIGIASLAVYNLFDTSFNYQDDSFREFRDEPSISSYVPERTIMGRLTISF